MFLLALGIENNMCFTFDSIHWRGGMACPRYDIMSLVGCLMAISSHLKASRAEPVCFMPDTKPLSPGTSPQEIIKV